MLPVQSPTVDAPPKTLSYAGSDAGKALKIGRVAEQLGISPSMIRAWEKMGLARPSRSQSRYRLYTSEDVRVLRRAVYLRQVLRLTAPASLNQLRQEGLRPENPGALLDQPSVGRRLRALRLQRGESLAKVANAVNVSVGFLSNVERSQSGASVSVLHKLSHYYGSNVLDFFSAVDSTRPLVRPEDRRVLQGGEGVRMELLAWGKITMEPHLFRLEPGAGSGDECYAHQGEEFLYIAGGKLTIWLADEEFELRAGDSFYFESKTPHRWLNSGQKETVVLWINTPPTF